MGAFLIMLVAGIAAVVIVACLFMCGKWLKDYITKRLQQRRAQDVKTAFVDTKEVVDDYLKTKAESADEISMEELENLTTNTPFIAVDINKTDNSLTNMEGMCPEQGVDTNFEAHMRQHEGILVFD